MTFTEMLSNALATVVAFLPNLLAALLILVVGLLVASFLGRVATRVLDKVDLPRRRTMRKMVEDEAVLTRLPRTFGRIVYWVLALITVGVAIDALQLTWLSVGVARVLAYLPSVLAAAAILVGAYLLGNYLYRLTARREDTHSPGLQPRLLPALLRAVVYVIAGFMALQELGVATTIVTSAFIIGLAAISIAAAVAFGLGNRELAGRVTREWYERRRSDRQGPRSGPPEQPSGISPEPPTPIPAH
jgi:small-conductance mechanosensitive channel